MFFGDPSLILSCQHTFSDLWEFWFLGFNTAGITHYIPSSWRAGETRHTAPKVECAQLQCEKPWEALSPTLKTVWIKCGRTHLQPQYSGGGAGGSQVHGQPQLHSLRPTWNAWDNFEIPKPAKQLLFFFSCLFGPNSFTYHQDFEICPCFCSGPYSLMFLCDLLVWDGATICFPCCCQQYLTVCGLRLV